MRRAAGSDADARQVPISWQMPIPERLAAGADRLVCQSSRVSQPKRAFPSAVAARRRPFAGQVAGVPGGVAAEGGQRAVDVVENQRQGAEREGQHARSPRGAASRRRQFVWERRSAGPVRCRRSSMLPMLYPTSPDPAGSIPRRAGGDCAPGRNRAAAACRRRSAGAAGRPGPSRSRWSANKVNPRPAIRIQTTAARSPATLRRSR